MKKICVMGLGYIGLPTAAMYASMGCDVIGVDIDINKVEVINRGEVPIKEPGLDELIRKVICNGKLIASTKPEKADAFLISVPTPATKDKRADLSCVIKACEAIRDYIEPGNIIVLESTVPPLTVEGLVVPILRDCGVDINSLYIGHCPERVIPGSILNELVYNDRIVGGLDAESTKAIADLYRIFVKGRILETDCATAEMVKLMENTYRDVNIALANEFALISENLGINVWEAIKLANCHPRVNIHTPGPGVGGHCIAVDPYFIIEKAGEEARIISLSRQVNTLMPSIIVGKVKELVSKGSNIAVLGVAYKGNIDDMRESPSLEIIKQLLEEGYNVNTYDPFVKENYHGKKRNLKEAVSAADCLLVLTDHTQFAEINAKDIQRLVRSKNIVDTRNIINNTWQECGFIVEIMWNGKSGRKAVKDKKAKAI